MFQSTTFSIRQQVEPNVCPENKGFLHRIITDVQKRIFSEASQHLYPMTPARKDGANGGTSTVLCTGS